MKTELVSKQEGIILRVTRSADYYDQWKVCKLLDHSWFQKHDVHYDQANAKLTIRLRRPGPFRRALGKAIWINIRPPKIWSLLTINAIEHCEIFDKNPRSSERQTVISGRLFIENHATIFFGAFCEHENPFHIILKVSRIDISLEDIEND